MAYIHPYTEIITLNVNSLKILIGRNFHLGFKIPNSRTQPFSDSKCAYTTHQSCSIQLMGLAS